MNCTDVLIKFAQTLITVASGLGRLSIAISTLLATLGDYNNAPLKNEAATRNFLAHESHYEASFFIIKKSVKHYAASNA